MEGERGIILTGGLRRVAITCRESVSSCAALAASGAITRILNGFKESLTCRTLRCQGEEELSLSDCLLSIDCNFFFRSTARGARSLHVIGDAVDHSYGADLLSISVQSSISSVTLLARAFIPTGSCRETAAQFHTSFSYTFGGESNAESTS